MSEKRPGTVPAVLEPKQAEQLDLYLFGVSSLLMQNGTYW